MIICILAWRANTSSKHNKHGTLQDRGQAWSTCLAGFVITYVTTFLIYLLITRKEIVGYIGEFCFLTRKPNQIAADGLTWFVTVKYEVSTEKYNTTIPSSSVDINLIGIAFNPISLCSLNYLTALVSESLTINWYYGQGHDKSNILNPKASDDAKYIFVAFVALLFAFRQWAAQLYRLHHV